MIREKIVTCRKTHNCEWCNEVINKNEKALSRVYTSEGEFNSGYQHLECSDAMYKSRGDIEDSFEPGSFRRGKTSSESNDYKENKECLHLNR